MFFCPSHYIVVECEPYVEVKMMREGSISRPIEITYETRDGTAKFGSDYVKKSGTVIFGANEETKSIQIGIIDDEDYEEDAYFSVKITSARYLDVSGAEKSSDRSTGTSGKVNTSFKKAPHSRANSIQIGPQDEAVVTILDDDHCGVFHFIGASIVVPDNLPVAEIKVSRTMGAHGRVAIPFALAPVSAVQDKDFSAPSNYKITFENKEFEKTIKIGIISRQRVPGSDSVFMLQLMEPQLLDEQLPPDRQGGLPKLGEQATIKVIITESDEMKDTLDRMQTVGEMANLFRTTWKSQFCDAITLQATSFIEQDDGAMVGALRKPQWYEYCLHIITLPWKLLFAALPPTGKTNRLCYFLLYYFSNISLGICNGWVTFFACIFCIGAISILIEDLAAHFGCVCGIDKPITAITVVAIGTSLPDMFASRAAAMYERTADAALAHISGSNAVNVYLGLGLAWTVASLHHRYVKGAVEYKPTVIFFSLVFSLFQYFNFSTLILPIKGRRL